MTQFRISAWELVLYGWGFAALGFLMGYLWNKWTGRR